MFSKCFKNAEFVISKFLVILIGEVMLLCDQNIGQLPLTITNEQQYLLYYIICSVSTKLPALPLSSIPLAL